VHNRLGSTLTGSQLNLGGLAAAVGLGSGLMYLLDPESGRRRRARARQKVVHLAHVAGRTARKARTDVKNRSTGLKYAVRSLATRDREVAAEAV
jgi:hypothetical protein